MANKATSSTYRKRSRVHIANGEDLNEIWRLLGNIRSQSSSISITYSQNGIVIQGGAGATGFVIVKVKSGSGASYVVDIHANGADEDATAEDVAAKPFTTTAGTIPANSFLSATLINSVYHMYVPTWL